MPAIATPLEATNPAAQAMCTGVAAPSICFRPGGTRKANIYVTEPILAQACTATFGMDGAFPLQLDFSLTADAHTLTQNASWGGATTLEGTINPATGASPALSFSTFTMVPPARVHNVVLVGGTANQALATNPLYLR